MLRKALICAQIFRDDYLSFFPQIRSKSKNTIVYGQEVPKYAQEPLPRPIYRQPGHRLIDRQSAGGGEAL